MTTFGVFVQVFKEKEKCHTLDDLKNTSPRHGRRLFLWVYELNYNKQSHQTTLLCDVIHNLDKIR